MGVMTLADFRTDLQSALGERGFASARLDRWINFGYVDLTGAVAFEVLANDEGIATVDSQNYITAPTNTLVITNVRDSTNDILLGWIPKSEYLRRPQTGTGEPTHWTRHAGKILLHPVPDGAYTLDVYTIEPPAVMSIGTAVSVLPDTWDPAIFQLAVHHALLALGDEQRSAAWLSRAITYIGSRLTEADFAQGARGLEASIPQGMEALGARLQDMQGAS